MSALDKQIDGNHYRDGFEIQPIEFIVKNKIGFIPGSIIKYACRYDKKGSPLKDLKKIKHYVDLLIEIKGVRE